MRNTYLVTLKNWELLYILIDVTCLVYGVLCGGDGSPESRDMAAISDGELLCRRLTAQSLPYCLSELASSGIGPTHGSLFNLHAELC